MSFVETTTADKTISGTAYLTGVGRQYLFNQQNIRFDIDGDDLFAIKSFALGDPDQNYRVSPLLNVGQIPDISGESEGCLKSAVDYIQTSMLMFSNFDSLATSAVTYNVQGDYVADDTLTINVNFGGGILPTGTDTGGGNTGGGSAGSGNPNSGFQEVNSGFASSPSGGNSGSQGTQQSSNGGR